MTHSSTMCATVFYIHVYLGHDIKLPHDALHSGVALSKVKPVAVFESGRASAMTVHHSVWRDTKLPRNESTKNDYDMAESGPTDGH